MQVAIGEAAPTLEGAHKHLGMGILCMPVERMATAGLHSEAEDTCSVSMF